MRSVVLCLGAAVCLCGGSIASAQNPIPRVRVEVPNVKQATQLRRPVNETQQLIFERAVGRAREREDRMEARRWSGYSPARPPAVAGPHYNQGQILRTNWSPYPVTTYPYGIYPY